jgi:hypothetical protein
MVSSELSLGDHGQAVADLYTRLRDFGYFPNPSLRRDHPSWVPVVAETPSSIELFGPELEQAVQEFQYRSNLEPTGRVDAETREALSHRACGVPDTAEVPHDEKWALEGKLWNKATIRWKVTQYPPAAEMSQSNVHDAIAASLAAWGTNHTFVRATDSVFDIEIKFFKSGAANAPAGWPALPGAARGRASQVAPFRVSFNDDENWWWASTGNPPAGKRDLGHTAIHEFGHTLGLNHSSVLADAMYTSGGFGRALSVGDRAAMSALYGFWQGMPGLAVDIAVSGPATGNPHVWAISGGNTIWKLNWSTGAFVQTSGAGKAIAVTPAGIPWVVDPNNFIWEGDINGSQWTLRGVGRDVAASGGWVFVISNVARAGGNYEVMYWRSRNQEWVSTTGVGVRIGLVNGLVPWVVQANGSVYRWKGENACPAGSPPECWWELMPGCARDVAGGEDGSVWLIGCNAVADGNYRVWTWNEQEEGPGVPPAEELRDWVQVDGSAVRISGAPDGRPWAVQANGALYRRTMR